MIESCEKNIIDEKGNIIISKEQRQPVECWSRVVGYYRPTKNWNRGKAEEFKERKEFNEVESLNSLFALDGFPHTEVIRK